MTNILDITFIMMGGILIGIGSKLKEEGSAMITCGCVLIGATLYFAITR